MGEYNVEKSEPEKVSIIPIEIEKVVLSTDTVKLIFQDKYGRPVEAVIFDATSGLWTIDFLVPSEVVETPPEDC